MKPTFLERLAKLQAHSPHCTANDLRRMEAYAKEAAVEQRRGYIDEQTKKLTDEAERFAPVGMGWLVDSKAKRARVLEDLVLELWDDLHRLKEENQELAGAVKALQKRINPHE